MEEDYAKGTLAHGACGTMSGEEQSESSVLSAVDLDQLRNWLRIYTTGAGSERIEAEVSRLLHLYNGEDVRRIINALTRGLPPLKRKRRNTDRMDWKSAKGKQIVQEIRALHETSGLDQTDACAQWQKENRKFLSRRNWSAVRTMAAESLKRQVFARAKDKLP